MTRDECLVALKLLGWRAVRAGGDTTPARGYDVVLVNPGIQMVSARSQATFYRAIFPWAYGAQYGWWPFVQGWDEYDWSACTPMSDELLNAVVRAALEEIQK